MVEADTGGDGKPADDPLAAGSSDPGADMSLPPETSARLDQLIADYMANVAAYCRWRCASEDDAQDAASEVFVVAWRRLGDVPDGDAARIWLLATARRVIANERRAQGRRHRLGERLRLVEPQERFEWPVEMAQGEVASALRQLDSDDREILLLAEWEGLTSNEIGAIVGCLAVTARGRLYRARQRFRSIYRTGETAGARVQPSLPANEAAPPSDAGPPNGPKGTP